jgi:hypothetical protein
MTEHACGGDLNPKRSPPGGGASVISYYRPLKLRSVSVIPLLDCDYPPENSDQDQRNECDD